MEDLKNLSPQELISRLRLLEKEKAELNKKNNALTKRIDTAEANLKNTKVSLKNAERRAQKFEQQVEKTGQRAKENKERADKAEAEVEAIKKEFKKAFFIRQAQVDLHKELWKGLEDLLVLVDDQTAKQIKKIFEDIDTSYSALIVQKNSLLSKVFQSGKSEALPESTKEKIEQQKNEFISTSYVGNSKFLTEAIRSSKRNVLGLKNTVSTLEKSLVQIATLEVPADKEQVKTRSKGRQKKTNPVPVKGKEYRSSPKDQCSCCGSHMVTVGEMTEQIRSQVKAIEKQCTILEQHHDLQICPKCGKAHVVMPADCDHPILPNRTISTHSVIEYAHWLSLGLPLQKKALLK